MLTQLLHGLYKFGIISCGELTSLGRLGICPADDPIANITICQRMLGRDSTRSNQSHPHSIPSLSSACIDPSTGAPAATQTITLSSFADRDVDSTGKNIGPTATTIPASPMTPNA